MRECDTLSTFKVSRTQDLNYYIVAQVCTVSLLQYSTTARAVVWTISIVVVRKAPESVPVPLHYWEVISCYQL